MQSLNDSFQENLKRKNLNNISFQCYEKYLQRLKSFEVLSFWFFQESKLSSLFFDF